ncbi:MAG: pyruvate kinase [Actinomycetota bacterium]|nr:pyruvate kinase [Acidimicrobiia bacterium]MDQ3294479.1 pyruvate kinase [Actinomycetota bacterium]
MPRRTKIVATIGPASESPEQLEALIRAGVDVCRLGLAHGEPPVHLERIARIRAAAAALGKPVAILCDLPGPKIRAAPFAVDGVVLVEGDTLELVPGHAGSTGARIEVEYDALVDDLAPGDAVTLGDGLISLEVVDRSMDGWRATVLSAGRVMGRPGVHLPAERLRLSTPTDDDLRLLEAIAPAQPEIVAVSFVRRADDLRQVRDALGPGGPMVMAKIETRAACDDLPAILDAADAVMVARGDLGIDCPTEEVPHLQKHIIRTCVAWGVPVVTATQMLESMVLSPMPTRAEASDVANAVFDGTDAVMLSGETAIGHDPELVVRTMARIVERAEQEADYLAWGNRLGKLQRAAGVPEELAITAAVTHAAWEAAVDLDAVAIVCCTRSGTTARAMARFRPRCALVSFSPTEAAARQLALSWGVIPFATEWYESSDEIVWHAVERAVQAGVARTGDNVVVIAGSPVLGASATSDILRVVRVR